jgi:adenine phosphoribosyltransferase
VTIVDDTLSTGGTLLSLLEGVRKRGVTASEILVLVEKVDNGGRARLAAITDIAVRTVMKIRVSEQGVVVL